MSVDRYTKVTHRNWFQNIFGSFVGAAIGVLLFFGSFVVLWMNEGKINWADVARSSQAVNAASVQSNADGKFVAATGQLVSSEKLGDAPYLQPGAYLKLERNVEMFAWEESEHSETRKEIGGGSTTVTTYEYQKTWTSSPESSANFEQPSGHTNPKQAIDSADWTVKQAKIGSYALEPAQLEMPSTSSVPLNTDNAGSQNARVIDNYLFIGKGSFEQPQVGDLRISYAAVPNDMRATVFGTQQGSTIVPYMYRGDNSFYRALEGDRAQAIDSLQLEHNLLTWILRIVGFFMMWIGMSLALGPISTFLDVLPALGSFSGFMIGLVTFVMALVMTIITVIIAIIAHSLIALIALLLLFFGGLYLWGRMQQKPVAAPA